MAINWRYVWSQVYSIRVSHDAIGPHSDFYTKDKLTCGKQVHDYLIGKSKPHYPMPAINNMAYELDEWIDRWQHGELNLQWAVEIN